MNLKIAPDEKIVKSWTYARYKEDKLVTDHYITITNKRIVLTEKSETHVDRDELLIDNVVGVSTEYTRDKNNPKKPAGIVLAVTGSLLLIAGIVLSILLFWWLGMIFIVPAAGLIVWGIIYLAHRKFDCKFSLVIVTNTPTATKNYNLLYNTIALPNKDKQSTLTVNIDVNLAEDIVDSIGALILAKGAQQVPTENN